MDNIPASTQTPIPQIPAGGGNKKLISVIIVVAVVVIAGGYWTFNRWQQERAVNNLLKQLGMEKAAAETFSKNMDKIADEIADEAAKEAAEAKKTPAEKFAEAEVIEVTNNGHTTTANILANAVRKVFGDAKITGYTSGYMGMNSGSGIIQFTIPKLLTANDAAALSKELENEGMKITATAQENESVTINAQKDDYAYNIFYNIDEQQINSTISKGG